MEFAIHRYPSRFTIRYTATTIEDKPRSELIGAFFTGVAVKGIVGCDETGEAAATLR